MIFFLAAARQCLFVGKGVFSACHRSPAAPGTKILSQKYFISREKWSLLFHSLFFFSLSFFLSSSLSVSLSFSLLSLFFSIFSLPALLFISVRRRRCSISCKCDPVQYLCLGPKRDKKRKKEI